MTSTETGSLLKLCLLLTSVVLQVEYFQFDSKANLLVLFSSCLADILIIITN